MRILVTGVFGFIGSHFCKYALSQDKSVKIIGFGRHTDQKNTERLGMIPFLYRDRLSLAYGDLANIDHVSGICEGIDVVVNFAAKTFVDHSLKDVTPFTNSNVTGAMNLMHDAMRYGVKRFVQVSTDEVYGQILTGAYKEDAKLDPRNPYAWSKACADLYALCLHRHAGFPVIVTRTENNFGGWQHRQKAIPTFVRAALADESLPVYGDGMHVRCWLHVEQHCAAIWHLIKYGSVGEVYHVAGEDELTNLALARIILKTLGKPEDMIRFVPDHDIRPGHDRRYALDCSKLKDTGFWVRQELEEKLVETVLWYRDNQEWTR